MLTATELKSLLRTRGLRLTKRLGQHHLIDERVIRRVVERCQLSREETVVEIGAGLGALTEPLAERASRVIAVEVDEQICSLLAERMQSRQNVAVLCQDIADFSWDRARDVTVVGAIPYHITSPILIWLCEGRRAIRKAVLIIQHEVAQRLVARPGTKAYGRLSVLGQYCWEITLLLKIPRSAFFPHPEVDSCCVQLLRRVRPPVTVESEPFFFEVVKASFSHRRKTLVNCLSGQGSGWIARPDAAALVNKLGLPASIRGEALSLDQFAALANALLGSDPSPGAARSKGI
jgi:16S rRNA (adenine1518-N6/adenine1519-N6)-dimethyltransferase